MTQPPSMLYVIKALESMILCFLMQMYMLWCHGYAYEVSNQMLGRNEKGRENFGVWHVPDMNLTGENHIKYHVSKDDNLQKYLPEVPFLHVDQFHTIIIYMLPSVLAKVIFK